MGKPDPPIADAARSTWRSYALPLIAVFFTVLGSRLWLIQSYGSDVPYWDQWDGEAAFLYKPMREHGFAAVAWFAPHNEHRIVLARLTSAAMLWANRQWDPLLQVCWEAVCAATIAALLCVSAARLVHNERAIGLVFSFVLIGLSMPFGWENTLAGFQTPFYYLILLALAMFQLCAYRGQLTWKRSFLIGTLGALSLITLASGALTCLAAACALAARLAFARQTDTRQAATLTIVLMALTLIGLGTTPTVPGHLPLHAQNFSQFITVLNLMLGWPTQFGGLIWLPFATWCIQMLRQRRIDAAGAFVLGLAVFVFVNAGATAYARGGSILNITLIASRYTDVAWYAWLVNLLAVLLLVRSDDDRMTNARRLVVIIAFVGGGAALIQAGLFGLTGAADRGGLYVAQSANTRNYLATGNQYVLRDKAFLQIPYPSADRLIQLLNDPTIRALLPPGIKPGAGPGRLRGLVQFLIGIGRPLALSGLLLFLASIIYFPFRSNPKAA